MNLRIQQILSRCTRKLITCIYKPEALLTIHVHKLEAFPRGPGVCQQRDW